MCPNVRKWAVTAGPLLRLKPVGPVLGSDAGKRSADRRKLVVCSQSASGTLMDNWMLRMCSGRSRNIADWHSRSRQLEPAHPLNLILSGSNVSGRGSSRCRRGQRSAFTLTALSDPAILLRTPGCKDLGVRSARKQFMPYRKFGLAALLVTALATADLRAAPKEGQIIPPPPPDVFGFCEARGTADFPGEAFSPRSIIERADSPSRSRRWKVPASGAAWIRKCSCVRTAQTGIGARPRIRTSCQARRSKKNAQTTQGRTPYLWP